MATTKKATTKKTTTRAAAVKKKAPAKKTAVKKTAPKKTTARKSAAKRSSKKTPVFSQSFKVANEETPFLTFKITRQTVYWVILVAFIIFVQLWIISLQVEVAGLLEAQQRLIYDSL